MPISKNPLAQALLAEYGSLEAVWAAYWQALCDIVDGYDPDGSKEAFARNVHEWGFFDKDVGFSMTIFEAELIRTEDKQ